MSNVEHTHDTNQPCPRATPWCARHESMAGMNYCWSKDVEVAGLTLTMTNGTTTGEPKVFIEDATEGVTFADLDQLARVVEEFRAAAQLTPATDQPSEDAKTTSTPTPVALHASWCDTHDADGDFCWSAVHPVAGLRLQLANHSGRARVVGLDDPHMASALSLEDVTGLTATLKRLEALAATDEATPGIVCPRFTWCTNVGTHDECASDEYTVRDLTGEQWAAYLQCSAGDDRVQVCIDGRAKGVPLSGRLPVAVVLGLLNAMRDEREAIVGILAAAEVAVGHNMLMRLLRKAIPAKGGAA